MSEKRPDLIASLKAIYHKFRPAGVVPPPAASDGQMSNAPSALEGGQGVNQKPDLPSGESGGTTNPLPGKKGDEGTT